MSLLYFVSQQYQRTLLSTYKVSRTLSCFISTNVSMETESVSCSVLSNSATPGTRARQAPLSMEFSRQEYWSGLPCPSPGNLLDPGTKHESPALQADSLLSSTPGKPQRVCNYNQLINVTQKFRCVSSMSLSCLAGK